VIDEAGAAQMLLPEASASKTIGAEGDRGRRRQDGPHPAEDGLEGRRRGAARILEKDLKRVVFGQDKAIEALSAAIKLARAGLREPEKPIGCYLFSGPTGVGKTEVAKQLADRSASNCCASTCRNTWSATRSRRLIGAPPGYVGFDQGGLLTDGVDQHPHCVLLLDEIEKAHPDLFNILCR
jgi:ATP-dependent Clp protease ATP-binding subunit ClpA